MSQELSTTEAADVARESGRNRPFFRPHVDIVEHDGELVLLVDMPGAAADSISVDYHNGTLTLHGTVEARQPEGFSYLAQEYAVGDFHREFAINENVDHERISAEYRDGVLTVHIPKAQAAKPRKIEVTAH